MPKKVIYTVGHSNHSADDFLRLLQPHGVNCVVDVRSIPASKYNPQFNKPLLASFLQEKDIIYLHFGREFGARHTNTFLHDENGRVDFEKVRQTEAFRLGVARLEEGIEKGYIPALMCAEANPLDCHRFSMIANYLDEHGYDVRHILKNGQIVSQKDLEKEILKKFAKKLPQPNIFEPNITREDQLKAAYRLHNNQVGWKGELRMENGEWRMENGELRM
ncbi:MAG TPA: DUF488 family protein [Bacteroidetes bacterium]|nr:DUF488 family protein [Bacteroidota bacterium]